MDTLETHRQIIETVLTNYASVPYAYSDIETETVFDQKRDHVPIDIKDGKVWMQRDGTERGIAYDLEDAGIPKNQIVLGFHEPKVRPFTGFAVA